MYRAALSINFPTENSFLTGAVKAFLSEKKYAFIFGDDGRDYFFHQSAQQATPRGYRAAKIQLLNAAAVDCYVCPETF